MNVDREVASLDREVRWYVYDHVVKEGSSPTAAETAFALSTTPDTVKASFQRLADGHVLVLQRGTGEILRPPDRRARIRVWGKGFRVFATLGGRS
jgi:hypothetical protein